MVSNDDLTTNGIDGYTVGHDFQLKFWDHEKNITYSPVCTSHIAGVESFKPMETYVGKISLDAFGIFEVYDQDKLAHFGSCYPNPFSDHFHLSYYINFTGDVRISVFNNSGILAKKLEYPAQSEGIYTFEIGDDLQ